MSTLRTECENSYFRYKCEKVILSSWGRLRPNEARVKSPHEDKITFSLVYRTQFFYTTCTKLDLAHAFLFERVQCPLCARSVKKYRLIHVRKIILHSSDWHPCFTRATNLTLVLESTFSHLYRNRYSIYKLLVKTFTFRPYTFLSWRLFLFPSEIRNEKTCIFYNSTTSMCIAGNQNICF